MEQLLLAVTAGARLTAKGRNSRVGWEPFRTVLLIMLDSGLRPGEIFRMRWENIHWGQRVDLQPPRQVPQIPALRSADRACQGSTADAQGRRKRRMGVSVKESPIRPYYRSRGFQAVAGSQTVGRYSRRGRPVLCSPSFLNRRDRGHRERDGGHGCDGASVNTTRIYNHSNVTLIREAIERRNQQLSETVQ